MPLEGFQRHGVTYCPPPFAGITQVRFVRSVAASHPLSPVSPSSRVLIGHHCTVMANKLSTGKCAPNRPPHSHESRATKHTGAASPEGCHRPIAALATQPCNRVEDGAKAVPEDIVCPGIAARRRWGKMSDSDKPDVAGFPGAGVTAHRGRKEPGWSVSPGAARSPPPASVLAPQTQARC
jgi:hypothetical protein